MKRIESFLAALPLLSHDATWGIVVVTILLGIGLLVLLMVSAHRSRLAAARLATERRRAERAEDSATIAEQRNGQLVEERETLRAEAKDERRAHGQRLAETGEEVTRLTAQIARLEADATAQERRIQELRSIRQEMTDRFAALSEDALKAQGARQNEVSEASLKALLGPVKANVDKFQEELRHSNEAAARERISLRTEIEGLARQTHAVNDQAAALTNALKGDKQKQGAWGEIQLKRLLEAANLREGIHFRTQVSERDADGRKQRPDVMIDMPDDRALVIDSKVSLLSYEQAVNASDDIDRMRAARDHCKAVGARIDELVQRSYQTLAKGGVDYVIMFVPIEGALAMAVEHEPDLSIRALERGVVLATPMTLMAILRTVEHVWAVDSRNKNALEIADRAGKLYDKVAGFVEDAEKVGRALETASRTHDAAMRKLSLGSGNMLSQADRLKQLGARAQKTIERDFDADETGNPLLPNAAAE